MKKITLKANAKINLSLIITGVMQNGFHELDTIMCPIELGDIITVTRRMDKTITCTGLDVSEEENTAVKAAKILMDEFGTNGVDIEITKNIPYSAGLGGSSADAAGIMYAFSKLFYIDYNKIKFMARQVGSDLSFLLQVVTGGMRARGKGDILTAEDIKPLHIVITMPDNGVETKDAYRMYDELKIAEKKEKMGDNIALINAIREGKDLCDYMVNDLYVPATKLNDQIEPLLKIMLKYNKSCAIMSGSGSSIIGICKNASEAKSLASKIPDNYYKLVAKTCKYGIEEIV